MPEQELAYEDARDQLVEVVRRLEQGGDSLAESIALWDRAAMPVGAAGGDRKLWAVWRRVIAVLASQGRTPRRMAAANCEKCRAGGYAT